jgi:DnaK suppressor protein
MRQEGKNKAYEPLRVKLEQRLAKLQTRLSNIKRDVTQPHSGDSAEQAQERENDEVVDAIGNETSLSIKVIQAALQRIENGTYGACDTCGKAIGEARLTAIPEATRCVDCAA